jgi:ferrochelatase
VRGVLLLAHGSPESLDEMDAYLTRVRGGRAPSPELVREMRQNYAAIGGRSPLKDITRAQAEALGLLLGIPVSFAMRHSSPSIEETLQRMVAEGVREVVALPLAPQYSSLSVKKYEEAVVSASPPTLEVRFVRSFCEEPALLSAFAEKVQKALEGAPDAVVFTAHSLPERVVREGDPYADEVARTARGVASLAGVGRYEIAYQSAGRTPEPWLGPTLEECLDELREKGARRVLVVPVGFVSDHTEILYDIDIKAASFARERGLEILRTESLNSSPAFIRALARIVG